MRPSYNFGRYLLTSVLYIFPQSQNIHGNRNEIPMANAKQIRISNSCKESLKYLLAKAITQNQLLLLSEIDGQEQSLSSFLRELSEYKKVPLSTLKLSIKNLKDSGLVYLTPSKGFGYQKIELTETGKLILDLILYDNMS